MNRIVFLSGVAALCLLESCATHVRDGEGAVSVVSNPEQVRGCAFLARLSEPGAESASAAEGMLRQRTSELGGNTLLLLPAGSGEAWNCADKVGAWAAATAPTATPVGRGRLPTPAAGPRS